MVRSVTVTLVWVALATRTGGAGRAFSAPPNMPFARYHTAATTATNATRLAISRARGLKPAAIRPLPAVVVVSNAFEKRIFITQILGARRPCRAGRLYVGATCHSPSTALRNFDVPAWNFVTKCTISGLGDEIGPR